MHAVTMLFTACYGPIEGLAEHIGDGVCYPGQRAIPRY
jgi:hypothetical protein